MAFTAKEKKLFKHKIQAVITEAETENTDLVTEMFNLMIMKEVDQKILIAAHKVLVVQELADRKVDLDNASGGLQTQIDDIEA